jgi:hypothetical protein
VVEENKGKKKEKDCKRENLNHSAWAANQQQIRSVAEAWRVRREAWLKPLEQ